jgi:hypothetical protein
MSESRASVPMSPPPSPPAPRPPHHTISGESDTTRALRIALKVREDLGCAPDPVTGHEGGGLIGAFVAFRDEVRADVRGLGEKVDGLSRAIADDRDARKAEALALAQAADKRREPLSWATRVAVGAAIVLGVGASFTAVGATLARHWH